MPEWKHRRWREKYPERPKQPSGKTGRQSTPAGDFNNSLCGKSTTRKNKQKLWQRTLGLPRDQRHRCPGVGTQEVRLSPGVKTWRVPGSSADGPWSIRAAVEIRGSSWGISEAKFTGRRVGAGELVQTPGADAGWVNNNSALKYAFGGAL